MRFTEEHPWAILPQAPELDVSTARAERDLYAEHFKHKRIARLDAACPPYRMGFDLGWFVRSPVSVTMHPLDDVDLGMQPGEDIGTVGRRYGRTEAWDRETGWVATTNGSWLQMYDFRAESGWQSMFLPNGRGTLEWHLGWSVEVPKGYFLGTLPAGPHPLDIPLGVVGERALAHMQSFSLACEPKRTMSIARGDIIARVVLLHGDSLQAKAVY